MAAVLMWGPGGASAQQICQDFDQSTQEVLPGVILSWDSSFLCSDAPDSGTIQFTVDVANEGGSVEGVLIERIVLTHTTPRPRGQSPSARIVGVGGLPLTLEPGEAGRFTVMADYTLVSTDEGKKANLHFRARGFGLQSDNPFSLGINAHVRGPGAVESGGGGGSSEPGGPPAGGGRPPWAGPRR